MERLALLVVSVHLNAHIAAQHAQRHDIRTYHVGRGRQHHLLVTPIVGIARGSARLRGAPVIQMHGRRSQV